MIVQGTNYNFCCWIKRPNNNTTHKPLTLQVIDISTMDFLLKHSCSVLISEKYICFSRNCFTQIEIQFLYFPSWLKILSEVYLLKLNMTLQIQLQLHISTWRYRSYLRWFTVPNALLGSGNWKLRMIWYFDAPRMKFIPAHVDILMHTQRKKNKLNVLPVQIVASRGQ